MVDQEKQPYMLRAALADIDYALRKINPNHYMLSRRLTRWEAMSEEFFAALAERGVTIQPVRRTAKEALHGDI